MKSITLRFFAPLFVILASLVVQPVVAQVSGVATSRTEVVLVQSNALLDAYRLIPENFPQISLELRLLDEEYQILQDDLKTLESLARLKDSNLNAKIRRRVDEISENRRKHRSLANGYTKAQMFVVEQLLQKLGQIQGAVAAAQNVSVIMEQGGHLYESKDLQLLNIDAALLEELNRQLPAARIVPPEGYNPSPQVQLMHRKVQAVLQAVVRRQSQAGQ